MSNNDRQIQKDRVMMMLIARYAMTVAEWTSKQLNDYIEQLERQQSELDSWSKDYNIITTKITAYKAIREAKYYSNIGLEELYRELL